MLSVFYYKKNWKKKKKESPEEFGKTLILGPTTKVTGLRIQISNKLPGAAHPWTIVLPYGKTD